MGESEVRKKIDLKKLIYLKDLIWFLSTQIKNPNLIKEIYLEFYLKIDSITPSLNASKIPQNFFYYWSGQGFQYVHYLSVLSLIKTTKCKTIVYYEKEEPNSPYWRQLKQKVKVKEYKSKYPWLDANHRSDIFRYEILNRYGGVYLDFDTLIIKDLTPLLNKGFIAGIQAKNPSLFFQDNINGAVLGSTKNHPFMRYCLESADFIIKKYNKLGWIDLGPKLLTRLYRKSHFIACKRETFYPYQYDEWKKIFQRGNIPDSYVIHFWGSNNHMFTKKINQEYIKKSDSVYAQIARSYI